MNPIVSIITPSYNVAAFIEQTIKSVQSQSFRDWELLLIDDCSTDNSLALIEKYVEADKRVKLFVTKENSGAAQARNLGLSKAKGQFIAFLDSDDFWMSHKLEKQLAFMKKQNCAISFTSYEVRNEDFSKKLYTIFVPQSVDYKGYLKNTIIGMSTAIIDKNKVGEFEFYNIRTRQDTYLWISLLKQGFVAYGLNEVLMTYRKREDSISANKFKAAKRVWYLYYKLEGIPFFKAAYYLCFYAFNALKKRR
ncbi:MAG: glycosyl transferase [Bacteroidetes bacterium 4572_77]|nr:MAG: glycosyl transferase [Bacteroidetes bacterium 4572_77]